MGQKISLGLLIILVLLGSLLRFYNLPGRATFEWDQDRDHQAVASMLATTKPVLVGPVIQGQGGFMLGPLYYYLLIPAHLIMGGDPLSQSVTSIILDLFLIVALYYLGNRLAKPPTGLLAAAIWALSAYTIRLSLVSWNVTLIPLYSLGSLALGLTLRRHFRLRYLLLAGCWLGLAWHIHPSVLVQIPLILWLIRHDLPRLTVRTWFLAGLACLTPLLPWVVFDLRHQFTNMKLLLNFLSGSSIPASFSAISSSIWQKYAFELSQLVMGRQLLLAGSILVILQLAYLLRSHHFASRFLLLNLIFSAATLTLMRNEDFGNYYLLSLLLPSVWVLAETLARLRVRPLALFFFFTFAILNGNQYRFTTEPFSLAIKSQVLETIAAWSNPVDLEISLPVGRRSAFDWYLAHESSLRHDDHARNVAFIVESDQLEINAPEKARSIVIEQTIGGFRFVGYQGN